MLAVTRPGIGVMSSDGMYDVIYDHVSRFMSGIFHASSLARLDSQARLTVTVNSCSSSWNH